MTVTDPVANLQTLIRCPSVTPAEGGALTALEAMLAPLGFAVERIVAREDGTPDVENLYARLGCEGPHLMFAGHTDVVPPGDESAWKHPPFSATIDGTELFGRGAVDMKGGIACFVAAVARVIEKQGAPKGSLSFLITGDEEGPSINGTEKLLKWADERGERWDACLVGEPTNPDALGDMIKIGRRGSLSGRITVEGVQGHVAYPHLADNPLRGLLQLTHALLDPPFDHGTDHFPPSNLEVTSIDTGNKAVNVIPARASAAFNIRFSDVWDGESLKAEILRRLDAAAATGPLRPGREPVNYTITWPERVGQVFLTRNDALLSSLSSAINAVTGKEPVLSTTGGTSDARFIKNYCPVVEFGLVGQTMHKVDERVAVADLEKLTVIYQTFIESWFTNAGIDEVRFYLRGLVLLARHDPQGFRFLDLTDRGMMRSFWAIVWCLPAIIISWLWRRMLFVDGMPDGFRLGWIFYARLGLVEAAGWIFPLVLVGLMLFALGASRFFPAVVTVSNWLAVPFAYAYTALLILLVLLPGAVGLVSLLQLVLVLALVTMLFRILYIICDKQNLMAGTLTMLLLVPALLLADWMQRFLGIFPL